MDHGSVLRVVRIEQSLFRPGFSVVAVMHSLLTHFHDLQGTPLRGASLNSNMHTMTIEQRHRLPDR